MFSDRWRELEEEALYIGLDIFDFWRLTPNQFKKYQQAFVRKVNDDQKREDMLNYILGQYIAYGVNSPKNYPYQPFLTEEKISVKEMTDEEMEEKAMRIMNILRGNK
ncbi:MAG: hypothetical protein FWF46_07565 [Oscillospiraceae bacterium]|nr:hypothetical protein [Oscillospiraceae bacterium]